MTSLTTFRARSARLAGTLAMLTLIFCTSLPAIAQPPPDPQPQQQQQQQTVRTGRSRSLGEQIAALNVRVRQLMPVLQNEAMRILAWVERLAWILLAVVIVGSGVREWHENNGQGRNLFWFFGRVAVCLLLFGTGPATIDILYGAGKDIAEGNEGVGESMLFEFYSTHRDSFNESYNKLIDGNFKVKGLGQQQEFAVEPIDGTEKYLGVIFDQQSTVRDFNKSLSDSSYALPRLFALMSLARGVMEAGDVWLVVLAGLVLIGFKIAAPIMIALGVDRRLSQRTVHAYIWGLLILTLVWPSVSYFLRALAYMAGNAAMAMGDADQVYAWTDTSLTALRNPLAQPFYTIVFGALMMLGAGLALLVSPWIAYSLAAGRVFEGVTQTASQYAGAMAGAAMEWYGSNIGAKFSRQADYVQVEGSYAAEAARAHGEQRFGNLGAEARRVQALGQAKAQREGAMGNVWANWAYQWGTTRNQKEFAINGAESQAAYAKMLDLNRGSKEMKDIGIGTAQQVKNISAQGISEVAHGAGSAVSMGARGAGGGAAGAVVGPALGQLGSAAKFKLQSDAAVDAMNKRLDNTEQATNQNIDIHDQYRDFTISNQGAFARNQETTVNISSGHAIDGINRSYGIQVGTANQVRKLETQANQIRFDSQMEAAKITRNAGMEAASLRAMGHVISQMASRVSRDIEKGIEMRF